MDSRKAVSLNHREGWAIGRMFRGRGQADRISGAGKSGGNSQTVPHIARDLDHFAGRAGGDRTGPGRFSPGRTAQSSGPVPTTLRFGVIDRSSREVTAPFGAILYVYYPGKEEGHIRARSASE